MIAPVKLMFIIWKNLKVIFRSWTSLMLVIIGPLLLIAIVGFAFGGEQIEDIKMGIYAAETSKIKDVVEPLRQEGALVYYYSNPEDCVNDVKNEKLHVCAKFSDDFSIGNEENPQFSTGNITFYYDNSKMNLVNAILNFIKENIAVKSEQITLESTKTILSNIEDSVAFMFMAQAQIKNFTLQAEEAKLELIGLRDNLVELDNNFQQPYIGIKKAQQDFNQRFEAINSTRNNLNSSSNTLYPLLDELYNESIRIEQITDYLNKEINLSIYGQTLNVSGSQLMIPMDFSAMRNQITMVKSGLSNTTSTAGNSYESAENISLELNDLVAHLDKVNNSLSSDIIKLNKNIDGLNATTKQLNELSSLLEEKIGKFSGISKEQASELLKPIKSVFSSLLGEQPKIFLVFPVLLAFIIMFISTLLSNMTVLNEVNSSAYFRNFLLPLHNTYFIAGLFITSLLIVIFQTVIFLLVGYARFGIDIMANFWQILLVAAMLASVFIMLGMLLGYLIRSEQTSILTTTFMLLALFLFSDVIFPIESMPMLAAFFAKLNPLVMAESMFRKILFYQIPLGYMAYQLLILSGLIIALFLAVVISGNHRKS